MLILLFPTQRHGVVSSHHPPWPDSLFAGGCPLGDDAPQHLEEGSTNWAGGSWPAVANRSADAGGGAQGHEIPRGILSC